MGADQRSFTNAPLKQCTGPCGKPKPSTADFFGRQGDGLDTICLMCNREKTRKYAQRGRVSKGEGWRKGRGSALTIKASK